MKTLSLLSICFILLSACEIIPDLERDNINDVNSSNYNPIQNSIIKFEKYNLIDDGNGNGIIEGETVYLEVVLKNTGTTVAKNISASYVINNPNVYSYQNSWPLFYDIYPNSLSTWGAENLIITFYKATPKGTIVKVEMKIYEDSKYKNDLSFNIIVN